MTQIAEQNETRRRQLSTRVDTGPARPRVVVVLPRGETIRNFVYTGALDALSDDTELTVLSVFPDGSFESLLRERYSDVRELVEIPERRAVKVLREIFDMAHGRWLWSKAAQDRWVAHDRDASEKSVRLSREIKKLACYPFANRTGLKVFTKLERAASRALRNTNHFTRLFEELRPSLIFNASHVHSRVAIQAVQAAQWLGIPSATFIFSWDNLTSQGRIMPAYDRYIVWNESLRDQLLGIYDDIRAEQVVVTGTPQFDFHFREEFQWSRDEFCARVGADPKRKIILYSTGMANHMPGEPEIVEGIAALLAEMPGSPQLLVRVYPKDQSGRFDEVKRRRPDILFPEIPWNGNWQTPLPEDSFLLTNMLRHADVGINIASTVSLELCMFDKPVINVGYDPPSLAGSIPPFIRYYDFDHYQVVVDSGAVEVARSEHEMRTMIESALNDESESRAERRELISKMFGETLDGRSGLRVAQVLLSFAHAASCPSDALASFPKHRGIEQKLDAA